MLGMSNNMLPEYQHTVVTPSAGRIFVAADSAAIRERLVGMVMINFNSSPLPSKAKRTRIQYTREEKVHHLKEGRKSGNAFQYCKTHGISYGSYQNWVKIAKKQKK
jgi:hypothetical protein